MNRKVLVWIFIVLAVVGVSTVTTTVYIRCFGHAARTAFPRRPMHPSVLLSRELGLSEAQIAELEARRSSFEERTDSTRTELREKRRLLMEELRVAGPDTVRVDRLVEEIGALQADLEKQAIRHMLQEQAMLTSEQREKFFSMFHKHFQDREFGDRKDMPWGNPKERPDHITKRDVEKRKGE